MEKTNPTAVSHLQQLAKARRQRKSSAAQDDEVILSSGAEENSSSSLQIVDLGDFNGTQTLLNQFGISSSGGLYSAVATPEVMNDVSNDVVVSGSEVLKAHDNSVARLSSSAEEIHELRRELNLLKQNFSSKAINKRNLADDLSSVGSRSVSSRTSGDTSSDSARGHGSRHNQPIVASVISQEQAQLEKMQIAMGILDASAPPDMNFVKHVTMVVKIIEARVPGGTAMYLLMFTENNYHLKEYLERQFEIQGLGELFPVPCKYFTRKTLDSELAKMKAALSKSGYTTSSLSIPSALRLPVKNDKTGYMLCYTLDERELAQMEEQIVYMCESFKIPVESKYNAGFSVKLQMDKVKLTSVNDVACIKALASIYRSGKQ